MSKPDEVVGERYRLVARIGSGGMGVVWEARDLRLERKVALKLLHTQPGLGEADRQLASDRAMREARISARLHHRYAVPVFDVVDHHGQPCLVMQFVPSIPLSAVLKESGPLDPAEVALVGSQVGSALAAAHEVGIVHRDVKPGNILIADDGSAMICDFGISRALGDATLTQTGLVHGTPAYLAPEVARGSESSSASDVFSFGATLYSAVEGAPPFGSDPNAIALLHRVAGGEFTPPRRSGNLAPLLVAMLAPRPEDRPTMAVVAQEFVELRAGRASSAPVTEPGDQTTRVLPPPVRPAAVAEADQTTPVMGVVPVAPAASVRPVAPTRPVASVQPVAPTRPVTPTPPAKPKRGGVIAVVVLTAIIVLLAILIWRLPDGSEVADPPTNASSSAALSPSPEPTPTPSPTPSTTPTPTPSPSSAAPTPTPTPTPSASSAGAATAAELAQAVTGYYALMPGGTDQGWTRLTASYQRNTSGGRASYERFWGTISAVSVSNATGSPPGTATATIVYTFKDGRKSTERTTFQLVRDDGVLKINSTRIG